MPTDKEQKRLNNLELLVERLERGEHIQNRTIKTHLTEEQYNDMLKAWEEQQKIRKELKDKPDAIKEYEALIRKAQFVYNKAESQRFKGAGLYDKAEALYERVIEHIQEQAQVNPDLILWLDRDPFSDVAPNPESIPRVITSRSLDLSGINHFQVKTKAQVKIDTLKDAINEIASEKSEENTDARLLTKLNKLREQNDID